MTKLGETLHALDNLIAIEKPLSKKQRSDRTKKAWKNRKRASKVDKNELKKSNTPWKLLKPNQNGDGQKIHNHTKAEVQKMRKKLPRLPKIITDGIYDEEENYRDLEDWIWKNAEKCLTKGDWSEIKKTDASHQGGEEDDLTEDLMQRLLDVAGLDSDTITDHADEIASAAEEILESNGADPDDLEDYDDDDY